MSFALTLHGTKKGVKRELNNAMSYGDQSQFDAVKAFVTAEIDAMPESVIGVAVDVSGHHDQYGRNLTLSIKTLYVLALDEVPVTSISNE